MSEQGTAQKTDSFNWILWAKWILVSTLGWVLGGVLALEILTGLVIGALQWIVLRPLIRQSGWWILSSALGWAAGQGLALLFPPLEGKLLLMTTIGAALGFGQWLILRWQIYRAWWWIVLSTLGWAVGGTQILGESMIGTIAGAATGIALEFLLRVRRPEPEVE